MFFKPSHFGNFSIVLDMEFVYSTLFIDFEIYSEHLHKHE